MKRVVFIFVISTLLVLLSACSNDSSSWGGWIPFTTSTESTLPNNSNNATDNITPTTEANKPTYAPNFAPSNVGGETLQYPAKNSEYEYWVYETYVEITKYLGLNSNVVVPAVIENLPVRSIGDWAFVRCEHVTNVVLPDGIQMIGYESFEDCTALRAINIPNSVRKIDYRAFHGCTTLAEITIPKSVTYMGEQAIGSSGSIGSYVRTDVIVKVYKASYALTWVMNNYIKNYEVLG